MVWGVGGVVGSFKLVLKSLLGIGVMRRKKLQWSSLVLFALTVLHLFPLRDAFAQPLIPELSIENRLKWEKWGGESTSVGSGVAGSEVGPEYAFFGEKGCRLYAELDYGDSSARVYSEFFVDESMGYVVWMKLVQSGDPYGSAVSVTIEDADTGWNVLGKVSYMAHVSGDVWYNIDLVDRFFKLTPGEWRAYYFDFANDYMAKYKRMPGNVRRISIGISLHGYGNSRRVFEVYVDTIRGYGGTEGLQITEGDTVLSYTASGSVGSMSLNTGWIPPGGVDLIVEKWYFALSMVLGWEPFTERWPLRYAIAWDPGKISPGNKFPIYVAVEPYAPQQGAPESLVSTVSPLGPSVELKAKRCIANLPCVEISISPTNVTKAVDVRGRTKAPLAGEKLFLQGDDVPVVDFGIPDTPISVGYIGGRPEVKIEGKGVEVIYNLKLNGRGFKSGNVRLTCAPSSWPPQWSEAEPSIQVIWADVPEEAKPGDKLTLNIVGFRLDAREYSRIHWVLNVLGHRCALTESAWFPVGNSNAVSPEINVDLGTVLGLDGGDGRSQEGSSYSASLQ